METKIVTGIDTALFYSMIKYLTETGWRISLEYSPKLFDKGIDFDLYKLDKNGETILFAWTNWFEGELKASSTLIEHIAQRFSTTFNFDEPAYLNRENIVEEMKALLDFE